MPSLYSLASLAFAFASLSASALAGEVDVAARALDLTDSIMAKHQLQKRRPNHADEYGYPHNLPKHRDGKRMSPGGYTDHRPQNIGGKCKRDTQCVSHIKLSAAKCDHGICSFRCLGDTYKHGSSCIGKFKAPVCKRDTQCKTSVWNASGKCNWGKCIFQCNHGYHGEGNKCVKDSDLCGKKACAPVENGWNDCAVNNGRATCHPRCPEYLGYQLFTNANHSAYRCINTGNDVDNCGSYGHRCPHAYNGKGQRQCFKGHCSVNCTGYRRTRFLPNGQQYCSNV